MKVLYKYNGRFRCDNSSSPRISAHDIVYKKAPAWLSVLTKIDDSIQRQREIIQALEQQKQDLMRTAYDDAEMLENYNPYGIGRKLPTSPESSQG